MKPLARFFIGHDRRERRAYEVAAFSLMRQASKPLRITPVSAYHSDCQRPFDVGSAGQRIDRVDGKPFSTDFAFARFMIPALCRFNGWAVFMDCDVLVLGDVWKMVQMAQDDSTKAVWVVKHMHTPTEATKMDGQVQEIYERKNWSSVMVWNCGHPGNMALLPERVRTAPGGWLHGFRWLADEQIGELPHSWNHLVDYDAARPLQEIDLLHYTKGGPWFPDKRNCGYAEEWRAEERLLMGEING